MKLPTWNSSIRIYLQVLVDALYHYSTVLIQWRWGHFLLASFMPGYPIFFRILASHEWNDSKEFWRSGFFTRLRALGCWHRVLSYSSLLYRTTMITTWMVLPVTHNTAYLSLYPLTSNITMQDAHDQPYNTFKPRTLPVHTACLSDDEFIHLP